MVPEFIGFWDVFDSEYVFVPENGSLLGDDIQ